MIFKNTFEQGINQDVSPARQQNTTIRKGVKIELLDNGEFFSVKNIRGTSSLNQFDADTIDLYDSNGELITNVNGAFFCRFSIDGVLSNCIIAIITRWENNPDGTKSNIKTTIRIYNIDTGVDYRYLSYDSNEKSTTSKADGVRYGEDGFDSFYYTDGATPIKRVYGNIVTSELPYNDANSLRRIDYLGDAAGAPIKLLGLEEGEGNVEAGAYQFVYRWYNKTLDLYSKWSIPSEVERVEGGINFSSNYAINLEIPTTPSEIADRNYIQFGIIKFIDGSKEIPNKYFKTPIIDSSKISTLGSGNSIRYYWLYTGFETESVGEISEIVIDTAAIQYTKTLTSKGNRLFAGSINYKPLDYDNGRPEISPETRVINSIQRYDSIGYFRDEVYRYYAAYEDSNGDISAPISLDFSNVTANSGTSRDFKFPTRESQPIIDNDNPVSIGLLIKGLKNHPSWAKRLHILRAKRRKNILYQSPFIGGRKIEPTGAYSYSGGSYPETNEQTGDLIGSYFPQILGGYGYGNIIRTEPPSNSDAPTPLDLQRTATFKLGFLYPPEILYNDGQVSWNTFERLNNYKIKIIDYILPENTGYNNATDANSLTLIPDTEATFYQYNASNVYVANNSDNYYFNGRGSVKPPTGMIGYEIRIKDGAIVPDGTDSGVFLKGIDAPAGDYIGVKDSISQGLNPSLPRGVVVTLDNLTINPDTNNIFQYPNGIDEGGIVQYFGYGALEPGSSLPKDNDKVITFSNSVSIAVPPATEPNVYKYSGILNEAERDGKAYQAYPIVNAIKGLGDNRYGDDDTQHEVYFTGASLDLGEDTILNNTPVDISVYGGDCIISQHTFKTVQTQHVITNPLNKDITDITAGGSFTPAELKNMWGDTVLDGGSAGIGKPEVLLGFSESMSCLLESEVYSEYADLDHYESATEPTEQEFLHRVNPSYLMNLGYNQKNTLKVLSPRDEDRRQVDEFKSRVIYSDPKVYNTDIEGFNRFPVLNFYDLEGVYGDVAALRVYGDNLIAVQRNGISLLPIEKQIIETADGGIISTQSGIVIPQARILSHLYGASNPSQAVGNGSSVFVYDDRARKLLNITNGIEIVSNKGVNTFFEETTEDISLYYDTFDNELHCMGKNNGIIYSEQIGGFTSELPIGSPRAFLAAVSDDQGMVWIGSRSDGKVGLERFKSSETDSGLFGDFGNTPYFEFIVNPDMGVPKIFDVISVLSPTSLNNIEFEVYRGADVSEQSGTASANLEDREGLYKYSLLRDSSGKRVRGNHLLVRIYPNSDSAIPSIDTSYRISLPHIR